VLDGVDMWARDFTKSPVYWLNGLAGTGKSAIAQTVAERMFADGRLGASFFCSRDFEDRSNLKFIFPTLAVQLARKYPEFRSAFIPLVQPDPEIAHESLYNQMDKLIMQPLRKSAISTVIVIDALDECKDEEPASAILSVLGRFVSEMPEVKFFVTGRPEPRIREGFRLPLLVKATSIFVLHDVEFNQVNNDIQRFFKHKFLEITRRRPGLDDWPTKEQLDLLCERAAGLFVYAVATVKLLDRKNNDPRRQLDLLLRSPDSSIREGKTKVTANTTLDLLYMSILQEAFGDDDPEDDSMVRSVLGAVILATNPLSPSTIAVLLDFHTTDVFLRLSSLHSLLILQEDVSHPVRPFHKSFPDFITDQVRCTNQRFQISPPDHHLELLLGCLELMMSQSLEKNMCNLPNAVKNSEVDDLKERADQQINHALRYACQSWHKHLTNKHTAHRPKIISALHHFLEKKFLCWLEVLSVLGTARVAVDALEVAAKWLEVSCVSVFIALPKFTDSNQESQSPTLDLTNDCFRFVTGFFEVISTSAPHIYHSALLLSPKESLVQKLYGPQVNPLARVVQGMPTSWDPSIANIRFPKVVHVAVWSPCGRFIATTLNGSYDVAILDAVTLEQIHTMHPQEQQTTWIQLVFSTDSHLLTGYSYRSDCIVSWDLQTGGLISNIDTSGTNTCSSMSYSGCGTMLGGLFDKEIIIIYNVLSGAQISSHSVNELAVDTIWTHGLNLQFATMKLGSIIIWEVSFTSDHPPTQVSSLPTPDHFSKKGLVLLPTLQLLAFAFKGRVVVWDAQYQKTLLDFIDVEDPRIMSFSSDGQFFVCGTDTPEFHLWKKSPDDTYLPYQKFTSTAGVTNPFFSPNGGSIISFGGTMIQLWHTKNSSTSPTSISTQVLQRTRHFLFEFTPSESLVAFTRWLDKTVTVLDLKSGNPHLVINADTVICGIGITENRITVVGDGKIISWELPGGDHFPNAQRNIDDSVQTTTFEHSLSIKDVWASISPDSKYVAFGKTMQLDEHLYICNIHTGKEPIAARSHGWLPGFSPGGDRVWSTATDGMVTQWAIVDDDGSNDIRLEKVGGDEKPQDGFPWHSSCGYQVTHDGWILSSRGKPLLWLPYQWRSGTKAIRKWNGKFLALLYSRLPEVVILELDV